MRLLVFFCMFVVSAAAVRCRAQEKRVDQPKAPAAAATSTVSQGVKDMTETVVDTKIEPIRPELVDSVTVGAPGASPEAVQAAASAFPAGRPIRVVVKLKKSLDGLRVRTTVSKGDGKSVWDDSRLLNEAARQVVFDVDPKRLAPGDYTVSVLAGADPVNETKITVEEN